MIEQRRDRVPGWAPDHVSSAKVVHRALVALIVLLPVGCSPGGCSRGEDRASSAEEGARRPETLPRGMLAHGRQITSASLEQALPPPPDDAIAYDIREPLRNGRTVPVKKRWIWIPDGERLKLEQNAAGRIAIRLPVGTKLFKEFYLQTSLGLALIERRLLLKVSERNEDNGWLLNGGWRFFAAHHLPREADGVSGFTNTLQVQLESEAARAYMARPEQWLRTQDKQAATFATFIDGRGERFPYVFPGQVSCELCHGGAASLWANAEPRPVMSFAPHPANLTPASLKRLVEGGRIEAPREVIAPFLEEPTERTDGLSSRILGLLQNNCLSCHSGSRRAAARETGFVLEPARRYPPQELVRRLSVPSRLMGALEIPLVTPARPDTSELVLRLRGEGNRRRMPPSEGGVPEPDAELTTLATRWIQSLAPEAARP